MRPFTIVLLVGIGLIMFIVPGGFGGLPPIVQIGLGLTIAINGFVGMSSSKNKEE